MHINLKSHRTRNERTHTQIHEASLSDSWAAVFCWLKYFALFCETAKIVHKKQRCRNLRVNTLKKSLKMEESQYLLFLFSRISYSTKHKYSHTYK